MMITAPSGNRCTFRELIVGDKWAVDCTWDETPTAADVDFANKEFMRLHQVDKVNSVVIEDPDRRALAIRQHLGGGRG